MPADALPPEVERDLRAIDDALAGRPVDDPGLALLVDDLREARPGIDPGFARDLDARAAGGFPRRRRRPLAWQGLAPALAVAGTLLAALVVALTALPERDGPGSGDLAGGGAGGGTMAPEAARTEDSVGPPASSAPSVAIPPAPGQGSPRSDRRRARKVETSASLTLVARPDAVDGVADGIVRVTDALGGFVVSSTVSTLDGGSGGGTFELRVPSARLQQALAQLSRLAHVRERSQSTRDITREAVSARDRLAGAGAERRSLLRRLARAVTDEDAERLKAQLRSVNRRIGIARADVARVRNRASFSTLLVTLESDASAAAAGDDGRWSPGDAVGDALRVLEVAAGVLLVALAILLPLGAVVGLGVLAARVLGRRRRERALDRAL